MSFLIVLVVMQGNVGGCQGGNVLDLTKGSAPTVFLGQLIEQHHVTTQAVHHEVGNKCLV